jgi:hypothetical protein
MKEAIGVLKAMIKDHKELMFEEDKHFHTPMSLSIQNKKFTSALILLHNKSDTN